MQGLGIISASAILYKPTSEPGLLIDGSLHAYLLRSRLKSAVKNSFEPETVDLNYFGKKTNDVGFLKFRK
jgi:hypothetical protein